MDVTPKSLEKFRDSLAERGLGDGTIRLYTVLLGVCSRHPKGMVARLTEGELAAKSLRTNRAALLAWATFSDDDALAKRVRRIRLPPAVRARPKVPFEKAQWRKLIHEIRTSKSLDHDPAMRAALFLVAVRGLRVSDALRLKRSEVTSALRSGRLSFEAKGRSRLEYDAAPIREALEALSHVKGSWERVEDLLVSDRCKSDGIEKRHSAYVKVDRVLRRLAKKAGMRDVHGHRFRRTYATSYLLMMQGDPQALAKITNHMGWKSPSTAMQYVDAVNTGELDKRGADLTKDILG